MAFPTIEKLPATGDDAVDFLRESVTAGDVESRVKNGVVHVMIPFGGDHWGSYGIDRIPLTPNPPPFWSFERDMLLRGTVHKESFWAGAIGIAISKIAAMGFEIKGDVPLRIRRGQEIMLYADGRQTGYVNFISKHLRDYLTCDNGSFIEIIRETSHFLSKVIGIRHLDSARCIRTGDPLIPVIYRDRRNYYHELKYHEVIAIADMPDGGETFNGVGFCAASRAYYAIYKLAAIEWYLREKVSGLQPLAIHIVNGILDQQLKDAIQAAKDGAIARGVIAHMGAVLIGTPADQPPNLVTIPLAELPDRFNRREEFDLSILAYANAIGLDPQDLQPLTGAPLGSGMQTEILHEKSKGRGLAGWRPQYSHQINEFVLAKGTTFTFYDKDFRDLKSKADLSLALANTSAARITAGITTPEEEKQILVDLDELPREFISEDATAGETLSDSEKPVDEEAQADLPEPPDKAPEAPPVAQPKTQPAQPAMQAAKTQKEFDYNDLLEEIESAQDIFQLLAENNTLETLKHLQGKHNQKRHAWRYSSNIPLSKLKKQRKGDDESEWKEYKARVRAKRAGKKPGGGGGKPPKKEEKKDPKAIYEENVAKLLGQDYLDLGDNVSDYDKYVEGNPAYKKWNSDLSSGERAGIKAYTNGSYSSFNGPLRNDTVHNSNYKGEITAMKTALERSALTENTNLYRGFSSEKTVAMIKSGQISEGGFFHDKGFMSTSSSKQFAGAWGSGSHKVKLNIKAPKGTKGAFMAFGLGNAGSSGEKEFVFPAGTGFYVKKINFITDAAGNGVYVLDLIPHEAVVNAITNP